MWWYIYYCGSLLWTVVCFQLKVGTVFEYIDRNFSIDFLWYLYDFNAYLTTNCNTFTDIEHLPNSGVLCGISQLLDGVFDVAQSVLVCVLWLYFPHLDGAEGTAMVGDFFTTKLPYCFFFL